MTGLKALFNPRSVAVIGASDKDGSLGHYILSSLQGEDYRGAILPVHPRHRSVHRTLCYRSVDDLPIEADLAVICTPPEPTPDLIRRLGARGTQAAIVVTADPDGRERGTPFKAALAAAARESGMRLLGPGSSGLQIPALGLNASFIRPRARPGKLALLSQSASITTSAVEWASQRGVGFSHVITVGDGMDVDLPDLIDHLMGDIHAKALLLHIDTIADPRGFLSAVRAAARNRPVLAIRPPCCQDSPTPGLPWIPADAVYEAALQRAGVLQVAESGEWFQAVKSIGQGKALSQPTVAILSNGAGPARLAAAAAQNHLAQLSDETKAKLAAALPRPLAAGNPVDLGRDASPARFAAAARALLEDPQVGALLVIYTPSYISPPLAVADALVEAVKTSARTIVGCWLGADDAGQVNDVLAKAGVQLYDTPEQAARAFLHRVRHRESQAALMQLPVSRPMRPGEDQADADLLSEDERESPALLHAYGLMAGALLVDRPLLDEEDSLDVLAAAGIPVCAVHNVADAKTARAAAAELGLPVSVVAASAEVVRGAGMGWRGDALADEGAVLAAVSRLCPATPPEIAGPGVVLRAVAPDEVALPLSIAVAHDPAFGRVIAIDGPGCRAVALPPLNLALTEGPLERVLPNVEAAVGHKVDRTALGEILITVSDLVVGFPEIAALEISGLVLRDGGPVVADARIAVAEMEPGACHLAIRPYPRELEEHVTLKDGREMLLRPVRPEDDKLYDAMIEHVQPEDLFLRFCVKFGDGGAVPRELVARLIHIDYDRDMAFIALVHTDDGPQALGVAEALASADGTEAEFSVLVRSDIKGMGLGRVLMEKIIRYCRTKGVQELHGHILRNNKGMRELAERLGFEIIVDPEDDMVEAKMDL